MTINKLTKAIFAMGEKTYIDGTNTPKTKERSEETTTEEAKMKRREKSLKLWRLILDRGGQPRNFN